MNKTIIKSALVLALVSTVSTIGFIILNSRKADINAETNSPAVKITQPQDAKETTFYAFKKSDSKPPAVKKTAAEKKPVVANNKKPAPAAQPPLAKQALVPKDVSPKTVGSARLPGKDSFNPNTVNSANVEIQDSPPAGDEQPQVDEDAQRRAYELARHEERGKLLEKQLKPQFTEEQVKQQREKLISTMEPRYQEQIKLHENARQNMEANNPMLGHIETVSK